MAQPSSPGPPLHVASYSSDQTAVTHTDEHGQILNASQVPLNGVQSAPLQPTPPGTPTRQRLLDDPSTPGGATVQFAVYPPNEKARTWNDIRDVPEGGPPGGSTPPQVYEQWVPWPLRAWFYVPLILTMAIGGIVLEVMLHVTDERKGWSTPEGFSVEAGILHYVYTLPPVAVTMFLVAMFAWTDFEIKKMQPYVDLAHGNSPPSRSLLLDYTRTNNFLVWLHASKNKHFLVALASLMALLALSFQPLAAALLSVRDTPWTSPDMTVNNQFAIGLNWDPQFLDLTSFLTAAGYASASVLYNLDDPPFIHDQYTVGHFELPKWIAANGTVQAKTNAVKSEPGCRAAENLSQTQLPDGTGWTISASASGCSLTWDVDKNATTLFGSNVPSCGSIDGTTPIQFRPVVFWFFTYQPKAAASATFCSPTISLWEVAVEVDIATGNLTKVTPIQPFNMGYSNFSSLSTNVTGPPLNGRAYNGIEFGLTDPNRFVLARRNATQLQMPAAVFQSAENSPEGIEAVFATNRFAQLATQVYTTYLKLVAQTVYFLPKSEPMTVQVTTSRKRLWLSNWAVHLLAAAMFLLALAGTLLHRLHWIDRQNLRLAHEPGTIASAMTIGAQTNIATLLDGQHREEDIMKVLRDKKFRIHPQTMKIVMEGEEGYDQAASASPRRSVFGNLAIPRRLSNRLSRPPSTFSKAA